MDHHFGEFLEVVDSCGLVESLGLMEFLGLMSLRPEGVVVPSLNIQFLSDCFLL